MVYCVVTVSVPPCRFETCGLLCRCSGWPTSRKWTWWCWGTPKESMLPCVCTWSSTLPGRQVIFTAIIYWIILWITGLFCELPDHFVIFWNNLWSTGSFYDFLILVVVWCWIFLGGCGRICPDTQTCGRHNHNDKVVRIVSGYVWQLQARTMVLVSPVLRLSPKNCHQCYDYHWKIVFFFNFRTLKLLTGSPQILSLKK